MNNLRKLFPYISDLKWMIIGTGLLSALLGIVGTAQPYGFKLLIDEVVKVSQNQSATNQLPLILLGLLVISALSILLEYFVRTRSLTVRERVTAELREKIYAKLIGLSVDYFERNKMGEISQRFNRGYFGYANLLEDVISTPLTNVVGLIVMMTLTIMVSPIAGLIIALVVPINVYLIIHRLRKLKPMRQESNAAYDDMWGTFNESIANITTVRTLGGNQSWIDKFEESSQRDKNLSINRFKFFWRTTSWRDLTNGLALMAAIGLVGFETAQGRHSVGDILLISFYVQRITSSIPSLARTFENISEQDTGAEKLVEMLEEPLTVSDQPNASNLQSLNSIEFKNVSFNYPGKKAKVLDNVSFKIEPSQTFALIGKSGVGKTTITKLLLRFYEPTGGQILINGQPIQSFTQDSVRQHMGVVMQDVALFNDTVEANLELANPKATKAQIRAAAEQAHANVFIEKLPENYKTLVGERGVKLSGGEKQRVAIARAILKDPQLIILDEATSALDSESERHVQAGLRELMANRTAIIIAHRLSTVMRADQILVLDKGKIAERGNHSELVAKPNSIYAKLFKLQSGALLEV